MAIDFCRTCKDRSNGYDKAPSPHEMHVRSQVFYGSAVRCEACRSHVRTLWTVFFWFPLAPQGSYRVSSDTWETDDGRQVKVDFLDTRGVPLRRKQVLKTWLATYAWVAASLAAWAAIDYQGFVTTAIIAVMCPVLAVLIFLPMWWQADRYEKAHQYHTTVRSELLLRLLVVCCVGLIFAGCYGIRWGLALLQWPEWAHFAIPFLIPLVIIIGLGLRTVSRPPPYPR